MFRVRRMRVALAVVLALAGIHVASAERILPSPLPLEDAEEPIIAAVKEFEARVEAGDEERALSKQDGEEELEEVIRRGWYDAATALLQLYRDQGVDLSSRVYQTASSIRRKLQHLQDSLTTHSGGSRAGKSMTRSGGMNRIAPAFEWAQSPDSVVLNVKFAHKLDTPATLGCEADTVKMEPKRLVFSAKCPTKRKIFDLKLDLFESIDHEASTWSMASVGRAMFTLRKQEASVWPRLLRARTRPGNMHAWWAMKEQFAEELKQWNERQENATKAAKRALDDQQPQTEGAEDLEASGNSDATASPEEEEEEDAVDQRTEEWDEVRTKVEKEAETERRKVEEQSRKQRVAIERDGRSQKSVVDKQARKEKAVIDKETAKQQSELAKETTAKFEEIQRAMEERLAQERARIFGDTRDEL